MLIVFEQWGAVCDDHFSPNDANVICRQLGFPLGASQALSHSAFGPGFPILMDDVKCRGNETSLADCIVFTFCINCQFLFYNGRLFQVNFLVGECTTAHLKKYSTT